MWAGDPSCESGCVPGAVGVGDPFPESHEVCVVLQLSV